ncbi:hypothetical protein BH23ACT8_BH23ACT8_00090 [soil metagenome]
MLIASLALVGVADAVVGPAPDAAAPDAVAPDAVAPVVETPGVEAVSGRSVCALGDARDGASAVVDVVRPGQAGDAPSSVAIDQHEGGGTVASATARLFPGAAARTTVEVGEGGASDVRWSSAPTVTTRSWRTDGEDDLPPGTAAGPCVPGTAATSWTVPGLTTTGGADARLRIANPHGTGATVAVGFLTPEGPDDPTRLRNLSVGPRESIELVVDEYAPEQDDLAAVVEVASGRVAVEGVQLHRSDIGGIDGVSLLQAATEPAETWTVPWSIGGEDRTSWLWIANRTDRSAPVELTYHTEDGGTVPELLAEVSVPPGTVRRIDLTGTLPEGLESAALTARSDGVPITVSGVAQLSADAVDDTGFAVQLGAPATDAIWTLTGTVREGRNEQLRLINPGSAAATVDATLWDGSQASQPDELTGIEVPPGALVIVPLQGLLVGAPWWALTVRASAGEVVAANVGQGDPDGPRHLVAGTGAPSAWWTTARSSERRAAPGTAQRLGTELGIGPIDPLAPSEGTTPAPPATEERDEAEGSAGPDADAG